MNGLRYLGDVSTVRMNEDVCTGCGMCATVCPHAVFAMENGTALESSTEICAWSAGRAPRTARSVPFR
jgi:Fe-S-cluster-containing hydrogenase component 2